MISKIKEDVYCFDFRHFGSKVYLIKSKHLLIDTSSEANKEELLSYLAELSLKPSQIKTILLTHMHIDHIGNIFLFPNAKIYAGKEEIEALKKMPKETTLINNKEFLNKLLKFKIYPLKDGDKVDDIKVIEASGHTAGSLCFLYDGILFSGDTVFDDDFIFIGRTDLPTSRPMVMEKTLNKIRKLKYSILCPGH